MQELADDVVAEHLPRSPVLVWHPHPQDMVARHGQRGEEIVRGIQLVVAAPFCGVAYGAGAAVALQQPVPAHLLDDEGNRRENLAEVVEGDGVVDHEVRLGRDDRGEHQAWAVAERDADGRDLQRLYVLGLSRPAAHAYLLRAHECINHSALAHVGVSHEADRAPPPAPVALPGAASGEAREELLEQPRGVHHVEGVVRQVPERRGRLGVALALRRRPPSWGRC
mmetsp:Transcript_110629/g.312967  ORF Transcript_110629/g.312967 Transcript_110629/m.312967 type:complete len:224 (+) Transcript_110629:478-1149(+)